MQSEANQPPNSSWGLAPLNQTAGWNVPTKENEENQENHLQVPPPQSTSQFFSGSQPLPFPDSDQYINDEFHSDGFLWDFMGTQPMLQWLDSDFSALEDTWASAGNKFPME